MNQSIMKCDTGFHRNILYILHLRLHSGKFFGYLFYSSTLITGSISEILTLSLTQSTPCETHNFIKVYPPKWLVLRFSGVH